jgi:DNA repair protein RecN (Recombination protein N)
VLIELAVSNLGVIADLRLVFGPGLTALTGETGAGKTMVVEAVELLVGGRAEPSMVRPNESEATVEGRFVIDDGWAGPGPEAAGEIEVVLTRVVPARGRSRAYVDGRATPVGELAEWGRRIVDLHGQHAHQSLLSAGTQRAALDAFGRIDLGPLRAARAEVDRIDRALDALGGDDRARAREIDLLRFQLAELAAAELEDADEEARLEVEEDRLAGASAHREAAALAVTALSSDGPAAEAVGQALTGLAGRSPFVAEEARLRALAAELGDVAGELRQAAETIDEDPERLAFVRERRQRLRELRRKYGDTLADVIAFQAEAAAGLTALEQHGEKAAALDRQRQVAAEEVAAAAAAVGAARRRAAPELAAAVGSHLRSLALPRATMAVAVGDEDPGDDVAFLIATGSGAPQLPLAKVASGGELARVMLALRLVLSGVGDDTAPPTLVFDEVDAGIGGQAAVAVGEALSDLAARRQVLVVTHLPQVAAFADAQVAITKVDDGRTAKAAAEVVAGEARVVELSRMLSGSPESAAAHQHAAELLEVASTTRTRDAGERRGERAG